MNQMAREVALDPDDASCRPDVVTHTPGVTSSIAAYCQVHPGAACGGKVVTRILASILNVLWIVCAPASFLYGLRAVSGEHDGRITTQVFPPPVRPRISVEPVVVQQQDLDSECGTSLQ